MSAPFWIDIIEEIVTDVQNDTTKPAALASGAPYYMHGHPLEILNTLSAKDNNKDWKYKKYPLIALFQDFTEAIGENMNNQGETELNIVICMQTSPDYTSAQRYDKKFRPVLYPLYDLLIKHIEASKWFVNVGPGLVPHDKTDRLFWGKAGLYGKEGNIFNDHIDAIEIDNLSLSLRLKQNCIK